MRLNWSRNASSKPALAQINNALVKSNACVFQHPLKMSSTGNTHTHTPRVLNLSAGGFHLQQQWQRSSGEHPPRWWIIYDHWTRAGAPFNKLTISEDKEQKEQPLCFTRVLWGKKPWAQQSDTISPTTAQHYWNKVYLHSITISIIRCWSSLKISTVKSSQVCVEYYTHRPVLSAVRSESSWPLGTPFR